MVEAFNGAHYQQKYEARHYKIGSYIISMWAELTEELELIADNMFEIETRNYDWILEW